MSSQRFRWSRPPPAMTKLKEAQMKEKFNFDASRYILLLEGLYPAKDHDKLRNYKNYIFVPPRETSWKEAWHDLAKWYRRGISNAKFYYQARFPKHSDRVWEKRKQAVFRGVNSRWNRYSSKAHALTAKGGNLQWMIGPWPSTKKPLFHPNSDPHSTSKITKTKTVIWWNRGRSNNQKHCDLC